MPTFLTISVMTLWLLSHTLGFALPALSWGSEQVPPSSLEWEQGQPTSHGYDTGFKSCAFYDAVLPSVTTERLGYSVERVRTTLCYDFPSIASIPKTRSSLAPSVVVDRILAAEGGVQTLDASAIRFSQSNVRSSLSDNRNANPVIDHELGNL